MKFVVLNRENFFDAMRLLHNPEVTISSFGELWVTLWMSIAQLSALEANRIQYRLA